jgi:hypothetical protein
MFKQGKRKINTKTFFSFSPRRRRRTREGICMRIGLTRGKINLHNQKRKRRREEVDLFAEAPRHLSRWGGNDSALCVLFCSPHDLLSFSQTFFFFLPTLSLS